METTAAHTPDTTVGGLLRAWRERRRLSQMALALEAGVSTRRLSYMETGRARPSREMVLRLADQLRVPLWEQNALLVAAGYAPQYPERPLADAATPGALSMVQQVLDAMAPSPALAIDRYWNLQATNRSVMPLLADVDPALLEPPVNVARLSLHPAGLAPGIVNLAAWRAHLLARLRREADLSADPRLEALLAEFRRDSSAPARPARSVTIDGPGAGPPLSVSLILESAVGRLCLLSATMVFGSAGEVSLSELAIETFFPADSATASALSRLDQEGGAA